MGLAQSENLIFNFFLLTSFSLNFKPQETKSTFLLNFIYLLIYAHCGKCSPGLHSLGSTVQTVQTPVRKLYFWKNFNNLTTIGAHTVATIRPGVNELIPSLFSSTCCSTTVIHAADITSGSTLPQN